jgi:pantetheine-phosphate adenylyltransferase
VSRKAVYAGSFDPLTNGHLDIIRRGLEVVDDLVVAVAVNTSKKGLFSFEERVNLLREALGDAPVEVVALDGLLIDFCRARNIAFMLRGLRAVSDFDSELQMANMNRKMAPEVDTIFLMTDDANFYVSSSLVREIASLGGEIRQFVPACVERALHAKLDR